LENLNFIESKIFIFVLKLGSNSTLTKKKIGIVKKFENRLLFPDETKEIEFKEKLLDLVQNILLQYNLIQETNDDCLTIDKKLLLVITHILLNSFNKNKLSLDFSMVKNEIDDEEELNDDFASTQINKQKIIYFNKMTFMYLKVNSTRLLIITQFF
jgi:hypothetical protein